MSGFALYTSIIALPKVVIIVLAFSAAVSKSLGCIFTYPVILVPVYIGICNDAIFCVVKAISPIALDNPHKVAEANPSVIDTIGFANGLNAVTILRNPLIKLVTLLTSSSLAFLLTSITSSIDLATTERALPDRYINAITPSNTASPNAT